MRMGAHQGGITAVGYHTMKRVGSVKYEGEIPETLTG